MNGQDSIAADDYTLSLQSALDQPTEVILRVPETPIKQPANPTLSVLGTPLAVDFAHVPEHALPARVTLPYEEHDGFDEESNNLFMYADNVWYPLNGFIDREANTLTSHKILIVEDERPIREMIAFHLSRAGFDTLEAEDCREARQLLTDERPALALIDTTQDASQRAGQIRPVTSGKLLVRCNRSEASSSEHAHFPAIIVNWDAIFGVVRA